MRAFIGIPVPTEDGQKLFGKIEQIRRSNSGIKWSIPENYHITTLFLGEIEESEVARVVDVLDSLPNLGQTEVSLESVGQFPPTGRPRVIVASIDRGAEEITRVQRLVTGALVHNDANRSYVPHVTLGRVRRGGPPAANIEYPRFDLSFTPSGITLFRSVLRSGGPVYNELHHAAVFS